jgi:hypothetical protein
MKLQSILVAFVIPIMAVLPIAAQEKATAASEKITIKLLSGETMVGKVAGIKDDSVSLATDYGVIRIPVSKITEESRKSLNIPEETDVAKLKNRITELEALVANLRDENAKLRRSEPSSPSKAAPSPKENLKTGTANESGVTYKLSKSGKRHNSRCRYFSSAGEQSGPNEGEPCKVCGG